MVDAGNRLEGRDERHCFESSGGRKLVTRLVAAVVVERGQMVGCGWRRRYLDELGMGADCCLQKAGETESDFCNRWGAVTVVIVVGVMAVVVRVVDRTAHIGHPWYGSRHYARYARPLLTVLVGCL